MSGTLNADVIVGNAGFQVQVGGATPISVDGNGNLTLGGSTLVGSRNKIINGKMDISQRGASFTGWTTSSGYCLDRWCYIGAGVTSAVNIAQQADAPSNEFQNSLRITVTTADTSVGAGDVVSMTYRIEGYDARSLVGQAFTLSFWVRSSKTGTHCVALANSNGDRCYVMEYTVNTANTWEKKTLTVPNGLITAGTWNWTNGVGLILRFTLICGTTYQGAAGSWLSADTYATSAQVNCMDTVGNIFAITGVQLEVGAIATPFEHRPYGQEFLLCQRYYEKSYDYGVAPGTVTPTGSSMSGSLTTYLLHCGTTRYAVPKRATPTISTYSPSSGSGAVCAEYNAGSTWVADRSVGLSSNGLTGFELSVNGTATTGNFQRWHWTSNAEL